MDKTQLTFKKFQDLATRNQTVPVYKRILADLLTPVAAWVHLIQKVEYAFLLESAEKGNQYARYSYIGINPSKILVHNDRTTTITENGKVTDLNIPFLDKNPIFL